MDKTYKSEQENYQYRRTNSSGGDAMSGKKTYKPEQESYVFTRKAAGGAVGNAAAGAVGPNAARSEANMPAMKKGGNMHVRKDHVRRKI